MRDLGGLGHSAAGDLHLTHRTKEGRKIPMLQLLGSPAGWPSLFEPKLVSLGGNEFAYVGLERHGAAWVLQQWDCELL